MSLLYPSMLNLEKMKSGETAKQFQNLFEKVPSFSDLCLQNGNEETLADVIVTLDQNSTGFTQDIQLILQLTIDKYCLKLHSAVGSVADFVRVSTQRICGALDMSNILM